MPSKFLLKVCWKLPICAWVCSNEDVTDCDIHNIITVHSYLSNILIFPDCETKHHWNNCFRFCLYCFILRPISIAHISGRGKMQYHTLIGDIEFKKELFPPDIHWHCIWSGMAWHYFYPESASAVNCKDGVMPPACCVLLSLALSICYL